MLQNPFFNKSWLSLELNGDGRSDIFWRNGVTGENAAWLMNGTNIATAASLPTVPTDWAAAYNSDFNGDGRGDIFWRNNVTGENAAWVMNGTNIATATSLPTVPTDWDSSISDFNGDGIIDIFWRNNVTGENAAWLMNGTNIATAASLPTVPTDWNLFTSLDFNGDGITDILSDFNGDARTDIFWRNNLTGETAAWLMDGTNIATAAFLPTVIDDGDSGVGTGTASIQGIKFKDLNGNGVRDTELVQGENPDVLFVIDISVSANDPFQGRSVGDVNGDRRADTILDAQLAGFIGLNQQLIDQALGDNTNVGIIAFGRIASQIDLAPESDGIQITTTPNADTNDNGTPDVKDVLGSLRITTGTNFENALQTAEEFFRSLGTEPGNGNLVFLSDGDNLLGGTIDNEVERLNNLGVNLSAFGVGESASLEDLQIIDPDAEIFTSTDELLNVFAGRDTAGGSDSPSLLEPGLEGVNIYLDLNNNSVLDDGEPSQVTDANGQYLFTNLAAGTYTVRELVPDGYSQTAPANKQFTIELGAGATIENIDFGNTLEDMTIAMSSPTNLI
jgi:hypothetical protein